MSKVRILETGEVVDVYFRHRDGVAYVGEYGIKLLFNGEFEEVD